MLLLLLAVPVKSYLPHMAQIHHSLKLNGGLSDTRENQTPKKHRDSISSRFLLTAQVGALLSSALLGSSVSKAFEFTEDQKALQQNQRPSPEDASPITTGIKPKFASVREDIGALIDNKPDKGLSLLTPLKLAYLVC
jgi:hypothetical protein